MSNPFQDEDQIVNNQEEDEGALQEEEKESNNIKEDEGVDNNHNSKPPLTDVTLLETADEFHNDKSSYLIKMFHNAIKQHLLDPEKQFILLTNDDINMTKFTSIWSNDPNKESQKFMMVGAKDVLVKDTDMPVIIQPIDAAATGYTTDNNTNIQHFPTNILKFNNNDYWKNDIKFDMLPDKKRTLSIIFNGMVKVKYLGINFVEPERIKQKFDILFKTDQRTELGEDVYYLAATDFENMEFDGIQLITFDDQIVTKEIILDFKSDIGAINYVVAIENVMKEEAMSMFLHVNRNKQEEEEKV